MLLLQAGRNRAEFHASSPGSSARGHRGARRCSRACGTSLAGASLSPGAGLGALAGAVAKPPGSLTRLLSSLYAGPIEPAFLCGQEPGIRVPGSWDPPQGTTPTQCQEAKGKQEGRGPTRGCLLIAGTKSPQPHLGWPRCSSGGRYDAGEGGGALAARGQDKEHGPQELGPGCGLVPGPMDSAWG